MTGVGVIGQAGVSCRETALVPAMAATKARLAVATVTMDRTADIPGL